MYICIYFALIFIRESYIYNIVSYKRDIHLKMRTECILVDLYLSHFILYENIRNTKMSSYPLPLIMR